MDKTYSLASNIFSGYRFFFFFFFFFRKWGQKMKGIFGLNMREEKALNTEIAVILHPLIDAEE